MADRTVDLCPGRADQRLSSTDFNSPKFHSCRFEPLQLSRSGSHSSVRNIEAEGMLGSGVAARLAFMEIFVAGSLDAVIGVRDQFSGRKLVAVFRLLHIRGRRLVAIHAGAAGWVVLPASRRLVRRCRCAKETGQDTCRQNQPCLRSAPIGRAARWSMIPKSGNRFSEKDHAPTTSWIVRAIQRNAITI
ncbi:hypothetical protein MJ8_45750 [Mesorhizobium sp. J8]|nr:hypothetical protein MJ8_45750 [Mesorhizobium sp. J8]